MPLRMERLLSIFWTSERGPYGLLFLLTFTLFVLGPLLSANIIMPVILEIGFSLILISGGFLVNRRTWVRLLVVLAATSSVLFRLLGMSITGRLTVAVDLLVSVGMLVCFVVFMARRFLGAEHMRERRIAGAVTIYLFIGLIWTRIYQLIDLMIPGAFHTPGGESLSAASLTYFSFVTLATLGYGDIVPVHVVARDLSILEAIAGQLYLVILISSIVSEKSEGPAKESSPVSENARNTDRPSARERPLQ